MPGHDDIAGVLGAGGGLPLGLIEEVVAQAGARERRRRLLPAVAVVIFVLGCALFSGDAYGEVARKLAGWLAPLAGPGGWRVPGSSALARARRRLGSRPLELLFTRLASPLADLAVPGAAAFGRRLLVMSADATTLDVPFTPSVVAAYGPPPRGTNPGGYPQLRLLALIGCGTRGLAGAALGPRPASEQDLARRVAASGALGPGMLVLADRNFCGYPVVAALAATGADVLIRARADQVFPVLQALPDGSARSVLADPAAAGRRHHRNRMRARRGSALPREPATTEGIAVRLIEAAVTATPASGPPRTERYRLITTITSHHAAPAAQAAALYHQRRESETAFGELKTILRGPRQVLRSRDPDLIEQETWALLCASQLIAAARARAAATARLDPDRTSPTATLRALRRDLTITPRPAPARARRAITTEILAQLLPPARRNRAYPRLTRSSTATRRRARATDSHVTYTTTITPHDPARHTHQPP